jgi:hypothetical protein
MKVEQGQFCTTVSKPTNSSMNITQQNTSSDTRHLNDGVEFDVSNLINFLLKLVLCHPHHFFVQMCVEA